MRGIRILVFVLPFAAGCPRSRAPAPPAGSGGDMHAGEPARARRPRTGKPNFRPLDLSLEVEGEAKPGAPFGLRAELSAAEAVRDVRVELLLPDGAVLLEGAAVRSVSVAPGRPARLVWRVKVPDGGHYSLRVLARGQPGSALASASVGAPAAKPKAAPRVLLTRDGRRVME